MKYLKLYEDFNRKTKGEEFFEWLSMKFGQSIGSYLGSGMTGMIYCFGKDCKRVIKLTRKYDKNYASIKDKNIKGVIKIFSNGKINVPDKFLTKEFDDRAKYVDVKNGMLPVIGNNDMYYTIMEYIKTDESLTHSIEDLSEAIGEFISKNYNYEFETYTGDEVPYLRLFFLECENQQFLQDLYNFIYEIYDKKVADSTVEIMVELAVLFKNIKPHFDWHDIHANQFGYNTKGELVAYDIDNPSTLVPEDTNMRISENEEEIIFPESKLDIEVYHGTDEEFDTFSQDYFNTKEPKGDYIGEGFFFTSDYDTAKKYGKNVIKAKLNIENPLMIETEQDAEDLRNSFGGLMEYFKIMKEDPSAIRIELEKRGYDGLIDNLYNQYAVFSPEQIKVIK